MKHFVNLVGQEFGRLTVTKSAGKSANNSYLFECLCVCGNTKIARASHLQRGEVSSCGCFQQENRSLHKPGLSHGQSRSATYGSWAAMKARCEYKKHPAFNSYGGRGITVCSQWRDSFETFLADMGERPEGMTLDRIDVNQGYSPGNCQWATPKQQGVNRRNNRFIVLGDVSATVGDWAKRTGIGASTIRERLKRGWSIERALQA